MESHTQPHIDAGMTLALAQASLAAYADFERKPVQPPPNFRLVARWTGWDDSIFLDKEERFGLLFQCTLPTLERTFILAFRGTDSDMDAYTEAFFETTPFHPTSGTTLNPVPYVSSGFYDIYSDRGGSMTHSMREQVFGLLDRYQPKQIYITGHSLGSALAQLFTLDIAVSRPSLQARCMNFSCPMVGTDDWKKVYDAQPAQQDPARRTIRVYNYWDIVPTIPPSIFGYTHVGEGFRTSFYVKDAVYPHYVSRHSLLNLTTVLGHAVYRQPQAWVGDFPDATGGGRIMRSTLPPTGADASWADRAAELLAHERELAGTDAAASVPADDPF